MLDHHLKKTGKFPKLKELQLEIWLERHRDNAAFVCNHLESASESSKEIREALQELTTNRHLKQVKVTKWVFTAPESDNTGLRRPRKIWP